MNDRKQKGNQETECEFGIHSTQIKKWVNGRNNYAAGRKYEARNRLEMVCRKI